MGRAGMLHETGRILAWPNQAQRAPPDCVRPTVEVRYAITRQVPSDRFRSLSCPVMFETPQELRDLQRLLDESQATAGEHLKSIFSDQRRLTAHQVSEILTGVQMLDLATVTASCQPLVAPVDGLFFHGQFHFGSSPDSVRFRHLRHRPQVSAAHTRGEDLTVIVHGTAHIVDTAAPENAPFREHLLRVYGPGWETWGAGSLYAQIEPRKMFAVRIHGS